MTNTLLFIWIFILLLGGSSVAALIWAVTSGQLSEFQKGATSIFDDDEPVGELTDAFPSQQPKVSTAARHESHEE
jgi:cbb3-type cytochrome oxidase maturation protein